MLIIPAVDIYNNKVVRLRKGNFNEITFYDFSPVEIATEFSKANLKWIHLVDLLGSKTGKISVTEFISDIKMNSKLKLQFGGGIRNIETAEHLFDIGVDRIVIGSLAVINKNEFEKITKKFNSEKLVVSIDVINYQIAIKGWTETTNISILEHINYCKDLGIKYFLCTDISKDGTLEGPNLHLYTEILNNYPNIKLIASGGIFNIDNIKSLTDLKLYGAVIGKALYENQIKLEDLKNFGS
ncbi:MAG: 1-(5-phosphoribosyl)-5-[(5-phosphoribosylamino) methylideneamino]imidazole-4-carboxamide isomerase [Ignavibacterium sp.]